MSRPVPSWSPWSKSWRPAAARWRSRWRCGSAASTWPASASSGSTGRGPASTGRGPNEALAHRCRQLREVGLVGFAHHDHGAVGLAEDERMVATGGGVAVPVTPVDGGLALVVGAAAQLRADEGARVDVALDKLGGSAIGAAEADP